ncbi:nucleotidyltransferase [Neobacillus sp. SM06]|uniref:nucleotidyltransferase n=1 Tax=Neobacillus sp. SM06 TaxID=3422492 RepID=UPI003D286AAE
MKAVGLIVEYNPFHNGHAYHLQQAKEISGSDLVIAVMSGNFLQRGEPAIVSKWYRAKMALMGGADLVFELPYRFATQKAETFANGAISLLDAAGCASICFGSESGDINAFLKTAGRIETMQNQLDKEIKQCMKTGISYPKALSLVYDSVTDSPDYVNLTMPNNILGYQYIRAIRKQKSHLNPFTIARKSAGYHDEHFASATIASATSIRKAIFSNGSKIDSFIPSYTKELLNSYLNEYGQLHQWEDYWPLLQFRLLQAAPAELRQIYEMEEGIENRLMKAASQAGSFQEFMEMVKTKRYTWTRLQRISTHILTNASKSEMREDEEKASYLRLLGMSEKGKTYLNKEKTKFSVPVISKLSSYRHKEIDLDIRAARIYAAVLPVKNKKALLQQEYTQPPIYLK